MEPATIAPSTQLPGTESVVPVAPIENPDERLQVLDSLSDYRHSRFTKRIEAEFPGIFELDSEIPLQDLKDRLKIIECFITKRGASKQAETLFKSLLSVADYGFATVGWEVEGASTQLGKDDDTLDLVEELRIKYKGKNNMPVEGRLALSIVGTYSQVNALNQQRKLIEQNMKSKEMKEKVTKHLDTKDEKLNENYKDL